jgi:chromosome segregation ATPase
MRLFTFTKMTGIIFLVTFSFYSCSGTQETPGGMTSSYNNMTDNSFSFREDGNKWRVDFDDGEISAIYKNGEKIPAADHQKYERMIYNRISGLKDNMRKFKSDMYAFKIDMEKFNDDMKELRKNLRENMPGKIEIEIDREEFNKGMDILKESLQELKFKKFEFEFDKDAFKEDMKKLKEDINKIDFDKIKIEVKRNIDDVGKELEKVKIKIKDIDINLSGLDNDLKKLSVEMEKLDSFLKEMKRELVKDGYLKSEDEKVNLILNEQAIEVNGKELPKEHHQKYLKLYEKHFDKKIKGDFQIKIRK